MVKTPAGSAGNKKGGLVLGESPAATPAAAAAAATDEFKTPPPSYRTSAVT